MTGTKFLQDQLTRLPEDSKKWKMAMYGLKGIAFFFAVGTIVAVFRPTVVGPMTTMVQIAMTAWGGVVAIYLGAQGSVEFKTTSALQTTQETQSRDLHIDSNQPLAPSYITRSQFYDDEDHDEEQG